MLLIPSELVQLEVVESPVLKKTVVAVFDFDGVVEAAEDFARDVQFLIEEVVFVQRIVVSDDPAFDFRQRRERAGIGKRGMAPADLGAIFCIQILGFTDQQVGIAREFDEAPVGGEFLTLERDVVRTAHVTVQKFVVADVGEAPAVALEFEADGKAAQEIRDLYKWMRVRVHASTDSMRKSA